MSLSTPQIAAQLERVLASDASGLAIAVQADSRQEWPASLTQHGRQFALRWCESSLAIREALVDAESLDPSTMGLVVLTPLATHQIAEDITARLARARVYRPESWDMVRQLFAAKETDARLGRYPWMPQALIDGCATGNYNPVVNGFLDLESAWQEVMRQVLGLAVARPDAVSLLQWSMTPGADVSLNRMATDPRADVIRWLRESAGAVGTLVLGCVESGRTADAAALGLICGVIFDSNGEGQAALGQAAVRLERYIDNQHVGLAEGRAWARAAEQLMRTTGLDAARTALDRADALLGELRISEFAWLSDLLPAALDQRLTSFAMALCAHVAEPSEANLRQVEQHADHALQHAWADAQRPRLDRVEMARRLARWLLLPAPTVPSLAAGIEWQTDQGAFVDWARFRLLGGDELPELSSAYTACREAVIGRRNAFDKPFAQALIQSNSQPGDLGNRAIRLESVLDQVVAPIVPAHPILLLVMDGLSTSIFRELFARLAGLGWAEVVPGERGVALAGIAALPTITEVSRASLLCGRLTVGAAAQEKTGFATHAALLAKSNSDAPPRLFHKGDLADATNLSADVRAAIANPRQKVIGVVYNAVDDHLSGPNQLHQRWALEDLRLLLPLLREAREARRVVVITADHGHLLEDGTTQVAGGSSDRWRLGKDAKVPNEMAVSGGRVVTGDGSNAIVALWGESTRYTGRKNGYHGGLSPQEVTVPLSVIVPTGMTLAGWIPAPPPQPEWWELPPLPAGQQRASIVAVAAPPARTPRRPIVQAGQSPLFEPQELPQPVAPEATPDWVTGLLSSAVYASQRQLAARVALPDDRMRALLLSLSERGGKLSRAALAQRLSLPEVRLGGMLSAVRRMLNVDQSPVLTVDEAAGTVELNMTLLVQQFGLAARGVQP